MDRGAAKRSWLALLEYDALQQTGLSDDGRGVLMLVPGPVRRNRRACVVIILSRRARSVVHGRCVD
jgi:hypothetical protein